MADQFDTQGTSYRRFLSNRNAMRDDYARATRLLRRQARRGDVDAALRLPQVRAAANAAGFTPGGIRSYEQEQATTMQDYNSLQKQADQDQVMADTLASQGAQTAVDSFTPETSTSTFSRRTINPNARPLGGSNRATVNPNARPLGQQAPTAEAEPQTQLGRFAQQALRTRMFTNEGDAGFRQGLDRAMGQAQTQQEVDELRNAGLQSGISDADFRRRSNWWNRRRSLR